MTRDDIPTPALLLDLDRFERNVHRMAEHVARHGKQLRPHAKTHKCPEIARRQIAAGARGVACAKLGEAEVLARAGIRGLLITTEVVAPAAIRRLMRLVSEAPDTLIVVDHADNVAALGREATADGVVVDVLVDVDVGNRRTGVAPGEPALALAPAVAAQRALRLRGLQGYAGDRKSTRLNSSHSQISYAVFCLKKKKSTITSHYHITQTPLLFTFQALHNPSRLHSTPGSLLLPTCMYGRALSRDSTPAPSDINN